MRERSERGATSAMRRGLGGGAAAVLRRVLLFTLLWWIIAEGSLGSPLLVLLVVAAATATSLALAPPRASRVRWHGVAVFLPWFLRQSIAGGIDVARRALDPALPIEPGYLSHRFRTTDGAVRVFMLNVTSLLPGTLSVELRDDVLLVHALDERLDVVRTLRELEDRVSRMFLRDPV